MTDGEVEIRYVIPTAPGSEQIRFCHLRLDYFDIPSTRRELGYLPQGEQVRITHIGQIHAHCDAIAQSH